jgi:thiazole synthase ThiGH ThiG subunit
LVQAVKQDLRRSPVSKTIRRQLGAFATATAIASAVDAVLLANQHAFAVENANIGLVHRNIEASKIVHVASPLPAFVKSSRPLPDVEKLDFRIITL